MIANAWGIVWTRAKSLFSVLIGLHFEPFSDCLGVGRHRYRSLCRNKSVIASGVLTSMEAADVPHRPNSSSCGRSASFTSRRLLWATGSVLSCQLSGTANSSGNQCSCNLSHWPAADERDIDTTCKQTMNRRARHWQLQIWVRTSAAATRLPSESNMLERQYLGMHM
mgnify:CR=1 FL=1